MKRYLPKEDPKINDDSGNEGNSSTSTLNVLTSLNQLISDLVYLPPDQILENTINNSGEILGSELIALYLVNENEPVFTRKFINNPDNFFPLTIPLDEVFSTTNPYVWYPDERTHPNTLLINFARNNQLKYLAIVPIGQPNATIGILLISDSQKKPAQSFIESSSIIANFLNLIIQNQSFLSEFKKSVVHFEKLIRIYEVINSNSVEAVLVLSPEFRIMSLNKSAVRIFGFSSQEALNQPVDFILIGSRSLIPIIQESLKVFPQKKFEPLRLFRRNGDDFLGHFQVLPIRKNEELETIVILVQDLSETEKLRMQTEQLEQQAFLGEFTAIFAHEVRNPVNNISTGLQLMSMAMSDDDPNQSQISRLQQDCDRLVDLMKSILTFSRPVEYNLIPLDIGLLIRRLVDRRLSRIQDANINHDLQIQPNTPLVNGDLRALEQVFNNLINNAIQAMSDSGGNLVIKVQPIVSEKKDTPKYVEISIADNGTGIPSENQDQLFKAFFTTKPTGTGLGLAIAKRIITLHKGNITLETFPGGTIFYVTLPTNDTQEN
jgi:two-component system sensor histidine kinase AtoS